MLSLSANLCFPVASKKATRKIQNAAGWQMKPCKLAKTSEPSWWCSEPTFHLDTYRMTADCSSRWSWRCWWRWSQRNTVSQRPQECSLIPIPDPQFNSQSHFQSHSAKPIWHTTRPALSLFIVVWISIRHRCHFAILQHESSECGSGSCLVGPRMWQVVQVNGQRSIGGGPGRGRCQVGQQKSSWSRGKVSA